MDKKYSPNWQARCWQRLRPGPPLKTRAYIPQHLSTPALGHVSQVIIGEGFGFEVVSEKFCLIYMYLGGYLPLSRGRAPTACTYAHSAVTY
jgi:hypothetical protein